MKIDFNKLAFELQLIFIIKVNLKYYETYVKASI